MTLARAPLLHPDLIVWRVSLCRGIGGKLKCGNGWCRGRLFRGQWPVGLWLGRAEPDRVMRRVLISKRQMLLAVDRAARRTQFGRTARSLHGQDQDQQGLVQMSVIELRSLP